MKEIRKKFKLTDFLRDLEVGDGQTYKMTERGMTDCSEVTRLS